MNKPLSKVIEELEDEGLLERCYMHREEQNGHIQLNIEFNEFMDKDVQEILDKAEVSYTESVAVWE